MPTEIYWPDDLPQVPQKSTYRRGIANNSIRSQPELGPVRSRRRTSANTSPLKATYILTAEEKDLLDQFIFTTESMAFWLPDPENKAQYIKVQIRPTSEESITEKAYVSGYWSVELNFDVFPWRTAPRSEPKCHS